MFDLILPIMGRYDLILGGSAVSIDFDVGVFYAILKYRIVSVSARWLRVMVYMVIMSAGAAIYMILFYLIFTALFKIPNPSTSILVLNFLMIIIVLLLMPVINEVKASIGSFDFGGAGRYCICD